VLHIGKGPPKYFAQSPPNLKPPLVVKSIKNIFKHSSVAGEIQLGAGAPASSPWGCGGTLTHSGVISA